MDLFEYQGKQYFARYDIPVSPGGPADTVDEAVREANNAGYPVVVKAQVQVGGRGKAGGIQLADDEAAVREHAGNILGMDIKGHVVKRVWVERASDIDEEYYVSFTLDRAEKKHLMMLSREGGVEIEVVAEENPDAIVKIHIDPVDGLSAETARTACTDAALPERAIDGATEIIVKLYRCYTEGDCDLAEINPLILKPTGEVHALDAKVTLDGNAANGATGTVLDYNNTGDPTVGTPAIGAGFDHDPNPMIHHILVVNGHVTGISLQGSSSVGGHPSGCQVMLHDFMVYN
ncbi:MAG: hypothetical protein GKR86_16530, partial [Ilumatobacter sp.]|nr:hypothetical protein [Ilumatobacter sp.]